MHADAGSLDGLQVRDRAVGGVRDDAFGTELAAEAGAPELVEEGLILHDVARGDQAVQDNAGFAAIHKVVGLVAQDLAAVRQGHRGGIRIGQADLAVGEALVAGRERTIRRKLAVLKHIPSSRLSRLILLPDELDQVLVHHLLESRHQGIQVGVAGHLGRIGEHLLAPDEAGRVTAVNHVLKEPTEDR